MGETQEKRHTELSGIIKYHNKLYYQDDAPEISDAEYDRLMTEIEGLEAVYPSLVTPDSPTQQVGYAVQTEFKKVTHSKPMLSLAKAHSAEEVKRWAKGIEKRLERMPPETKAKIRESMSSGRPFTSKSFFLCDPPVDTLAEAIEFENKRLAKRYA